MNLWKRFWRWKRNEAYWEQSAATEQLHHAWSYLYHRWWHMASNRDRGAFLPDNQEALDILHRLAHESLERQCKL